MKCGLVKAIDTLEICQIRIYKDFFNPKKGERTKSMAIQNLSRNHAVIPTSCAKAFNMK